MLNNENEFFDKFDETYEGKPVTKNHNRAYYRRVRVRAIARKRNKCTAKGFEWYPVKGMYSKGKIHCSCPMCSAKTDRNDRKYGYCASDKRKINRLEYRDDEE